MKQATLEQFQRYVIPNYTRYPVCLVRGEGSSVWDDEGNRYLDFFPGWGCDLLGHCPPRIVAGRAGAGRPAHSCAEYVVHRGAGQARPGAERTHRLGRPVLLLQQRHRGHRGGHQDRPAARQTGPLQDHQHAQQLPRPHAGGAERDGTTEVSSGTRTAAGRLQLRSLRRSRRGGPAHRQRNLRHPRRTDPGRGRHQSAAGRLFAGTARVVRPPSAVIDLR